MNSIYKFLKSTSIFFVGTVLSKMIVFFLLPVYTKYLPKADYGYYDLSFTYVNIVTSVLFFSIWETTLRFMYENKRHKFSVIFSGWSVFSGSTLIYILLAFIISIFFDLKYFLLIVLFGITINVQRMYTFSARGFGLNIDFVISGLMNSIIMATTNVILIIFMNFDFSSLYIASISGNLVQIIYLDRKLLIRKNVSIKMFDKKLLINMIKYTLPLSFNSVSYWLLTGYNRIAVSQALSLSDNGIYAVGISFGNVIAVITTCFTYAWQDLSFSRDINAKDNDIFYSKAVRTYMIFLGIGMSLFLPLFKLFFPILINQQYNDAFNTIPLFLISAVLSALSTFIGNIFYAQKKTNIIFISMILSSLLNLLLVYKLIDIFGLNGAIISVILGFTLNITIRAVILKKMIKFRFDLKVLLVLVILISLSYEIYLHTNNYINLIWMILVSITTLLIYRKSLREFIYGLKKRIHND